MPRSGPQRAGSPRRVRHLPAVAAIVDDRVEREAPLPNPGRLAPPQDVSYPRCRSQPVGAPTHGDPAVQGGTVGGNGRACGCSRSGRLRRIRRSEGNRLRWERSLLVIGATLVLVSVGAFLVWGIHPAHEVGSSSRCGVPHLRGDHRPRRTPAEERTRPASRARSGAVFGRTVLRSVTYGAQGPTLFSVRCCSDSAGDGSGSFARSSAGQAQHPSGDDHVRRGGQWHSPWIPWCFSPSSRRSCVPPRSRPKSSPHCWPRSAPTC